MENLDFMNLKAMMRPIALFVFLSLALTACNSDDKGRPYFKSIDFSYFDISPLSFTLKIHNQDSVFLKQNFSPEKILRNDTTYKAVLTVKLKQQLDSLMAVVNFDKLDSAYETSHLDGDEYKLQIEVGTVRKYFRVYSMSPPKELEALKELFLKIRISFLPFDTTPHLPSSSPKAQVEGNPKAFVLKDIDSDKYFLADSINKAFHEGHTGQTPLIAIDGIAFKYPRKLDTVALPLSKSDIANVGFINKKDSHLIYGNGAESGAIIITTTRKSND